MSFSTFEEHSKGLGRSSLLELSSWERFGGEFEEVPDLSVSPRLYLNKHLPYTLSGSPAKWVFVVLLVIKSLIS
jgi:hypothetical protein